MYQYVMAHKYHGYVLALLTLTYFFNILDQFLFSAESPPFVSKQGGSEGNRDALMGVGVRVGACATRCGRVVCCSTFTHSVCA